MYHKTMETLKKKSRSKYDFMVKGGKLLHNALFKLYQTVWKVEEIPDSWRETVIV